MAEEAGHGTRIAPYFFDFAALVCFFGVEETIRAGKSWRQWASELAVGVLFGIIGLRWVKTAAFLESKNPWSQLKRARIKIAELESDGATTAAPYGFSDGLIVTSPDPATVDLIIERKDNMWMWSIRNRESSAQFEPFPGTVNVVIKTEGLDHDISALPEVPTLLGIVGPINAGESSPKRILATIDCDRLGESGNITLPWRSGSNDEWQAWNLHLQIYLIHGNAVWEIYLKILRNTRHRTFYFADHCDSRLEWD